MPRADNLAAEIHDICLTGEGGPWNADPAGEVSRLWSVGKLPVRDVAKRMGVSVATLYRHVGKRGADDDGAHG